MGGLLLGGGVEPKPNRHKLNRKEWAMKLTSAQVERTLTQFRGEAIPDNHPVIPQLNSLFGEHTFFLDRHGLNIVEPAEAGEERVLPEQAVQLRNHWMVVRKGLA